MVFLKGALALALVLIALGLALILVVLTWPVGVLAGMSAIGWRLSGGTTTNPVKRAARSLLGPIALGLTVLSVMLLAFNIVSPESAQAVGDAERLLVRMDNTVPQWTRLKWRDYGAILTILLGLTFIFPSLKLLSKFMSVKRLAGQATSVLAAATSFTFFTNAAVLRPRADDVYVRIEAIYRNSRAAEQKSVGRFLAARAIHAALLDANLDGRQYVTALLATVSNIRGMDAGAKQLLADYVARDFHAAITSPLPPASPAETELLPHREAVVLLDQQLRRQAAADGFADEMVKGLKELSTNTLGLGTKELKTVGWAFVDKLVDLESGAWGSIAKSYLDKVLDKSFEKYTDPLIDKGLQKVRPLFRRAAGSPTSAQQASLRDTEAALRAMRAEQAALSAEYAREAMEKARAVSAIKGSEGSRVESELAAADRAAAKAEESAALAKAASTSVAGGGEVVKEIPEGARAAAVAAGAIEAAEAARVARLAAEAAQAARAARGAVQAARAAARAAAEEASGVVKLIRLIPK